MNIRQVQAWRVHTLRTLCVSALALCICIVAGGAYGQAYPARPVRLVVPATPGGGTDLVARVLSQKLGETLGQQVVVENRGGASGMIGSEFVARAAPDGHTLLLAYTSHVTNPGLYLKMPYDTVADFAPISLIGLTPSILVVHPSLPVRTVKELIALARRRPAQLNYSSAGSGSASHLAAELFASQAGIGLVQVPYKGTAPALNDAIAGQVSLMFGVVGPTLPHVKSERLRGLAVTSLGRSTLAPYLPTISEAALPGYESSAWFALLAPARTPEAVINRLNTEVVRILKLPDVEERLASQAIELQPGTPAELGLRVQSEIAKWRKVIQSAGVTAE